MTPLVGNGGRTSGTLMLIEGDLYDYRIVFVEEMDMFGLGILVALMQVPAPLSNADEVIGIECDVGPLCPSSRKYHLNISYYAAKEL